MQKIVLLGAGGHAHACIDVIEQCKKYSIAGSFAVAINKFLKLPVACSLKVLFCSNNFL